jgi:hypothetical protein
LEILQQVWLIENTGWSDYDALNLAVEKRYSHNWSARVSSFLTDQKIAASRGRRSWVSGSRSEKRGRVVRHTALS